MILTFVRKETIDFTICNPPFYDSWEEVGQLASTKKATPSSICTGNDEEMTAQGGEVEFIQKMIKESVALKDRIR